MDGWGQGLTAWLDEVPLEMRRPASRKQAGIDPMKIARQLWKETMPEKPNASTRILTPQARACRWLQPPNSFPSGADGGPFIGGSDVQIIMRSADRITSISTVGTAPSASSATCRRTCPIAGRTNGATTADDAEGADANAGSPFTDHHR